MTPLWLLLATGAVEIMDTTDILIGWDVINTLSATIVVQSAISFVALLPLSGIMAVW